MQYPLTHSIASAGRLQSAANQYSTLQRGGDLRRAYPGNYGGDEKGFSMYLLPVKEQLVSKLRPALLVLLGVGRLCASDHLRQCRGAYFWEAHSNDGGVYV